MRSKVDRLIKNLKPVTDFPYSDEVPVEVWCKWSGTGDIHCTESIREKRQTICRTCSMNPDKGLNMFKRLGGLPRV